MIGISDRDYAAIRFEGFAREVLAPLAHPLAAPLAVEVFQTPERLDLEAARRAEYRPVEPGFRWGPVWSTAWFRLRGRVPEALRGRTVALRFSSGTEALLWIDGAPRRGFDENRDVCRLLEPAAGGEELELSIEAACNHPLGISTFWWDPPEVHARWRDAQPGRLEACELVTVDEDARRFLRKYELARNLALALPEESARCLELLRGLRAVTNALPLPDPRSGLEEGEARLDELLRGDCGAPATTCTAVGHAHLDTAWLWPLAETRRKVLRSWSNALEVMERRPGFRFLASQAQQYAWCQEDSPALFERIRQRVREGRWEAGGAMWVEPDCHAPAGESFVRQILHGTRFWRAAFGDDAPQSFLFLPDTFGFPASLPQVMRLAGLATFVTDKIAWSERNEFPHVTFRWRGLDGSEVLTHLTPGTNYNAPLQPADLLRGEGRLLRLDGTPIGAERLFLPRWLQPFGFGDGGGGPTEEQAARAEVAAEVGGLPRVELGRADDFCAALHAAREAGRARTGRDLPVWDGELYLEQHRGTFTTHAWLKAANAGAEERLRAIEALLAAAGAPLAPDLRARLDAAWKTVLLHQFHDILPGSSIGAVYEDARRAYAELENELQAMMNAAAAGLADGAGALVVNPCSHVRSAVIDVGGAPRLARDLPALGLRVLGSAHDEPEQPVVATGRGLANGLVAFELDDAGRVARLQAAECDRPVNAAHPDGSLAPLNQLALYEDRPRRWEAWNVDEDYADQETLLDGPAEALEVVEAGPLRAAIEVRRAFGESRIAQRYVLCAGARRVEVETRVEWRERRRLLRALFPTGVRARRWTSGIQFGHLERPAHRNGPWDRARFEVPGRRWMDLSQPGLGLAVLDQAKIGRSCEGATLGLSLLRAPCEPDPEADLGEQRMRYALFPHGGDWRAAGVPREADELAEPALVFPDEGAGSGPAGHGEDRAAFELTAESGDLEVAAFKHAEEGHELVLRLVERHGGFTRAAIDWRLPVRSVRAVDLLERPLERALEHAGARTTLTLSPFEIVTLRVATA